MAHIQTQTITIHLSKLIKGNDDRPDEGLAPADFDVTLESLIEELLEDGSVIVEVVND